MRILTRLQPVRIFYILRPVEAQYSKQLASLRQRIPIGIRHGQDLLLQFNGDIEEAIKKFQQDMTALVVSKTGVSPETAFRHLTNNNLDISKTLRSIDQERYTLTELIVRHYKSDKEQALLKITSAIEDKYKLKRDFWLQFDFLNELPAPLYCVMTVMEWLSYEGWEGYDYALFFELDIVIPQIDIVLQLKELAFSLHKAKHINECFYKKYASRQTPESFRKATRLLQKDATFKKCEQTFKLQEPLLIAALHQLVTDNISLFP